MIKRSLFILPCLLLLQSCFGKKELNEELAMVVERHSFEAFDPARVRSLLGEKGPAGLRLLDRHAMLAAAVPEFRPAKKKLPATAGFLVDNDSGALYVRRVFRNSLAEKAGVSVGDRLLSVDGGKVDQASVIKALEGAGPFELRFSRRGKGFDAQVGRSEYPLPPLTGFFVPAQRASFLRVWLFFEGAVEIISKGLRAMGSEHSKSVIVDLRDSAGGHPREAAAFLGLFAQGPGQRLLSVGSRHKGYSSEYDSRARGPLAGKKVIVLVNGGTAMVSEVVAASLKELYGAVVVGAPTRGSVSIQKTFRLKHSKRGLRLTVSRFLTARGEDLEGKGLKPDVLVEQENQDAVKTLWQSGSETVLLRDSAYQAAVLAAGQ